MAAHQYYKEVCLPYRTEMSPLHQAKENIQLSAKQDIFSGRLPQVICQRSLSHANMCVYLIAWTVLGLGMLPFVVLRRVRLIETSGQVFNCRFHFLC